MFLVYNFLFIYSVLMLTTHKLNLAFFMGASLISIVWLCINVDRSELKSLFKTFKFPIVVSLFVLLASTIPVVNNDFRFKWFDFPSRLLLMLPIVLILFKKVTASELNFEYIKKQYAFGAFTGSVITFLIILYQKYYLGMQRPEAFVFVLVFSHICLILGFQVFTLAINSPKKRTYIYSIASVVVAVGSCFFSGTRGAWLYVPLLFLFCLMYIPVQKKLRFTLFASSFIVLLLGSVLIAKYNGRVASLKREIARHTEPITPRRAGWSITQRVEMLKFGTRAVKNKPFFGSSDAYRIQLFKNMSQAGDITYYEWHIRPKPGDDIHNTLFNFLTRKGIIFGLLSYLALILFPFYILLKAKQNYLKYAAGILGISIFVSSLSFDIFNLHQTYEFYSFFTFTLFMFLKLEEHNESKNKVIS